MIPAGLIKARVIDVRNRHATLPRCAVADANILYIIHYDFTALGAAGGKMPPPYQTDFYPSWWKRAVEGGVKLCTSVGCLADFAHIVERTELENLWRTDPNRPELDPDHPGQDFNPKFAKTVRYHYHGQLQAIREGVETTLEAIQKTVNVLPQVGQDTEALKRAVLHWIPSAADFGDATLVAAAKRVGMPHIISDDADLVTFDGITLYTANRKAIDSAIQAGQSPESR
jgi:hypothetical protein